MAYVYRKYKNSDGDSNKVLKQYIEILYDPEIIWEVASILKDARAYEFAMESFQKVIELQPDNADVYVSMG